MTHNNYTQRTLALTLGAIAFLAGAKLALNYWVDKSAVLLPGLDDPRLHQLSVDLQLMDAARKGDRPRAQRAIQAGASVNAFARNGETAISVALKGEQWEVAELCLEQKFLPATTFPAEDGRIGCIGDSALYWACRHGRLGAVTKLLESGARPGGQNTGMGSFGGKNIFQKSPIAGATESGSTEIIGLLLKQGVEANVQFNQGDPLLWIPIRQRNLLTLQYLLRNLKQKPDTFNNVTTLDFAISEGWGEGAHELLDAGYLMSSMSNDAVAAIKDVKLRNHFRRVRIALAFASAKFANPSTRDSITKLVGDFYSESSTVLAQQINNLTPESVRAVESSGSSLICYALDAGKLDAVRLLVAKGARINLLVLPYGTALCLAVKTGNLPAVEYLVANGANLEATVINGTTPLGWAVATQNRPIFDWLMGHGVRADPPHGLLNRSNSQDITEFGGHPDESPLMIAAAVGNEYMVKRLLEAGANLKLVDSAGKSVMLCALLGKNDRVVKLLAARGVDAKAELAKAGLILANAIAQRNFGIARSMLEIGVPITSETLDAATSILEAQDSAVAQNLIQEFKMKGGGGEAYFWRDFNMHSAEDVAGFLEKGGHVEFPGITSPLQQAIYNGRLDVAKILLEKGANPNGTGNRIRTPLILYSVQNISNEEECIEMIRLLLSRGAGMDAPEPPVSDAFGNVDPCGQTALMNSLVRGTSKITRALLDFGASITAEDGSGRTVFYYLEHGKNYSPTTRRLVQSWLDEEKKTLESGEKRKNEISL